jgi:Protein of unknown function (DUF3631)
MDGCQRQTGCSQAALLRCVAHRVSKKIITEPPPQSRAPVEAKIRAAFPYKDENGKHVYDVVRFDTENKDQRFRYRLPSGEWKLGNSRRVLYRLPELIAAIKAGERVLFCEGEKDVEYAVALGYAATTNCGGVGQWRVGYDQHFKGADVVIVGDNDDPGRKFAAERAGHLQKVAKILRSVFPPEGKDLTEWVKAGGTRVQFDVLIQAAPVYQVQSQGEDGVPESAPSGDDEAELERLAHLDAFDYERSRAAAAKALGVRSGILDRRVTAKRAERGLNADDGKQGRPMRYDEAEPWPMPVDGAALLDEIAAAARRFIVLPEHGDTIAALWPVHTYLLDITNVSPRLQISAPDSDCGKSTDFTHALVRRPQNAVNLTPAVTFRLIDRFQPTILLDEADATLPDNEDLRSVLDSGHHPRGEVPRLVGEELEPRAFKTYGAVAFALIGRLSGKLRTLDSRSIVIRLQRKRADQIVEEFNINISPAELAPIRRRIVRFVQDNREAIAAARVEMPLSNRRADNWRILFQIAAVAGGEWPRRARDAAAAPGELVQSQLEELLTDIKGIFAANGLDVEIDKDDKFISSTKLASALAEIDGHSWAEYGRSHKPITANKLAKLLSPVKIFPSQNSDRTARGYYLSNFAEAFKTYGSPTTGYSKCPSVLNAANTGSYDASEVSETAPRADTSKSPTNADEIEVRDTWILRKRGNGEVRHLGLSDRDLDEYANRIQRYAADHLDQTETQLTNLLRGWLRDDGVLPEHIAIEAARVIDRVFAPLK